MGSLRWNQARDRRRMCSSRGCRSGSRSSILPAGSVQSFSFHHCEIFRMLLVVGLRWYKFIESMHPHAPVGTFAVGCMVELVPVGVFCIPGGAVMCVAESDQGHLHIVDVAEYDLFL